jgi:hypothetical protein
MCLQAEYVRLMAARDQLTDSITSLEAALDGADQVRLLPACSLLLPTGTVCPGVLQVLPAGVWL